ncbi:hypothetical protein ANO11243_016170 [Dothideomycetidae sp. 11243]|nr:hypothetical protein ANO11243_016170 [fungal sp. No.11243]
MAASNPPSTALVKRKAGSEMALMPPPPLPPKRIKRPSTVLDEDTYTDALSHIIARDYFPGLLENRAQQDYLDALDAQDDEWIREAGQNLRAAMTPGPRRRGHATGVPQTPASVATTATPGRTPARRPGSQTPSQTPAGTLLEDQEPAKPVIDLNLSLQAFQAKYTSEDNASFNDVLDAQNIARAKKYAHLRDHTNTLPSKRRIAQQRVEAQKLLISSEASTSITKRPSQDLSARPASYAGFPIRQGARNTLMFTPDDVEEHTTISDAAETASLAPPRQTNFAATRLPGPENTSPSVPASPSMSAIDAAIAGRPRLSGSEASTVGSETPRVNGWAFVDEQPTETEIAAVSEREKEELAGLLPVADADGQARFKLADPSRREETHRRLVEKTKKRDMKSAAGGGGGGMTPAARSLAGRLMTPARGTAFGNEDAKKAWTPLRTPVRRP